MSEKPELSDFELDALRETANIGTGSASIALSALVGQKVTIDVPKTSVVPVRQVGDRISRADEPVIGIYSSLQKGMSGNILFVLPQTSAFALMGQLKNRDEGIAHLGKEEMELLKKLGSVVCSAYLAGLAKLFEQRIEFRTPNIVSTVGRSIVDFMLVQIADDEEVLLISVAFNTETPRIDGTFTLLFTLSTLAPLLEKLRRKMGMA